MNLMQKLNSIMKEVGYVQKDKPIGDGRFAYTVATYDQVIAAVRKSFVGHGIVVMTRQCGLGRLVGTGTFFGGRDGKPGVEAMRFEALFEVDFINADDPDDRYTVPVEAHAIDQGDKAPGKAQTYATKAAIKKALLLESGDDEESRAAVSPANDDGPAPITQPQERKNAPSKEAPKSNGKTASAGALNFLRRKLKAEDRSEEALCKFLGIAKLEDINEEQFAQAKNWLAKAA